MRMTGVDWRPFKDEFPILFGTGKVISLWVGQGWFEILWNLCVALEDIARTRLADGHGPLRVVQVKEKYGTLCFYVEGGSAEIHDLIDAAETASESTCEACGQPGNTLCIRGWYQTLCPYHELGARIARRSSFGIAAEDEEPESASWNVLFPLDPGMPRDPKLYLADIANAVADITNFINGMERHAFEQDELVRDAVLYLVGVIGTASRQIPLEMMAPAPSTSWRLARGLRDHPAVECYGLDDDALWSAIKMELPLLAFEVGEMLRSIES
jgi:uncharacterized protein with HEPN domain